MGFLQQYFLGPTEPYRDILIFVFVVLAGFLAAWAIARIGLELFSIYRRYFLSTVDEGFRDALIFLDPGQIFLISTVLTVLIVPIILYFSSVALAAVFVVVMIIGPGIVMQRLKHKRALMFVRQLPDGLTSMSSAIRSGMNLIQALDQVVKNQPKPLSSEFAQVIIEYKVGHDLIDSLDDLAHRIGKDELILLSASLAIAREFGGNVADTIESLAGTLREKRTVEAKVFANTALGRAQGLLALILPAFVGFVFHSFEPETMQRLYTTPLGRVILGAMIIWMILGWISINRVTKIDI